MSSTAARGGGAVGSFGVAAVAGFWDLVESLRARSASSWSNARFSAAISWRIAAICSATGAAGNFVGGVDGARRLTLITADGRAAFIGDTRTGIDGAGCRGMTCTFAIPIVVDLPIGFNETTGLANLGTDCGTGMSVDSESWPA